MASFSPRNYTKKVPFHYVWAVPLHGEIVQAMHKQLAVVLLHASHLSSHCPLSQLWDNDYCLLIIIIHSKYFPVSDSFKTTHIIHHNQLLLTKFGKKFNVILSKVLPKTRGHFWLSLCFCFKVSLCAKPFLWKWLWFAWKWNCTQNSFSHESFCTWTRFERETRELRNGQFC